MKKLSLNVLLSVLVVLAFATVALAEHPKALYPGGVVPLGPYSPGIKAGNLVFVSGQVSAKTNITDATKDVMNKIFAILQEANMDFDNVIMATVYLQNLDTDFSTFNVEYGKFFGCEFDSAQTPNWVCDRHRPPPARATIQASDIPPAGANGSLLEVSVIATK
jgi:2-iminobutanoate/2-iminopropanoate deaminase